ncbi:MAG TPA: CpaD family pilus assembly lipoprotein [Candidatus Angelobacter sp.]|nr:CpaD family pilus assembly lipoprotein [Candidatus Angelobacter sp.]
MKTNNRTLRQAASVLALTLAPLAMSACTDHRLVTEATWKQQEPVAQPQVQRVDVQHVIAFASKDLEISDVEREALAMFVRQSNLQPGSHVAVAAPTKTAAQAARSRNRLASVRNELQRQGISSSIVQAQPTNSQSTGEEIVVFAQTVAVLPPDCPGYNQPISLDYEWRPATRLGCANAINLGLMVANPSDLAQGRPIAPADAEAMAAGVDRYRTDKTYPTGDGLASVPFRVVTNQ